MFLAVLPIIFILHVYYVLTIISLHSWSNGSLAMIVRACVRAYGYYFIHLFFIKVYVVIAKNI